MLYQLLYHCFHSFGASTSSDNSISAKHLQTTGEAKIQEEIKQKIETKSRKQKLIKQENIFECQALLMTHREAEFVIYQN